jgi:hypothetical protein
MHHDYADIRSLIPQEPDWWDEYAVPRYGSFAPNKLADIYSDECALVMIACQACGHKFPVAFSSSSMSRLREAMARGAKEPKDYEPFIKNTLLEQAVIAKALHYGDPPNINCCAGGATMNCDDLKVLEFWRKENWDWKRHPELEVELEDSPA